MDGVGAVWKGAGMALIGWHSIIILTVLLLIVLAALGVVWLVQRTARRDDAVSDESPGPESRRL